MNKVYQTDSVARFRGHRDSAANTSSITAASFEPSNRPIGFDRAAFHFTMDQNAKFVLDASGKLIYTNNAADDFIDTRQLMVDSQGQLQFGEPKTQRKAKHIITQIISGRVSQHRLMRRSHSGCWNVFQFEKRLFGDTPEILVTLKDNSFCQDAALDAVKDAFGLTLTETTVVGHMVNALSPKEIGYEMDISTNTVRAHLRSIYSKTGVRGYHRTLRLVLQMMH